MLAPYVRALWALLVTALMMLMAGASPARAAVVDDGTAPQPFAGLDAVAAGGRFTELSDAVAANARAVDPTGPVEVVLTLQGNSLAAEQSARRASGLPVLDSTAQKAYVASGARAHAVVAASVRALGGRVLYDYRIVYNGIAVVVDRSLLARVAMLPGVDAVARTQVFEPTLDHSVPFILGGESYAELGGDGTGVTIGVIDTGVDYTHADLGGSGSPADYAANNPTFIEPGTFPTAKVFGGTDLVGEWYSAGCPPVPPVPGTCSSIPMPDPDPLDLGGHGSHVSGIAAGIGAGAVPHGVAPGARIFAIKVFALGSTSSAIIAEALELAADPNGDGDTSDHLDVVNMSLGGPFGRETELGAVASNAAVDARIIVVASAGNSGNIPYITGSPAAAGRAISVAAGNDPGLSVQLLRVAGTSGGSRDGDYESLEGAFTVPLSVSGARTGTTQFVNLACTPFPPGSLAGQIPLIARGTCTFVSKIQNVQDAGAIGAVVYNNVAGAGPIVMGGSSPTITIPGVMVGNADGLAIRAALTPATTFTLDPANILPIQDRLQSFTSRGPRFGDSALKPDITAPGGAILSVLAGSGTGATSLSGTSMSSPHVAGAAAILRQLHPSWSVEEIKAVLMNTATDTSPGGGIPYPLALQGSGRVRVDVAASSESLVVPPSASFLVLEHHSRGTKMFSQTLELRNKGAAAKTFALSSAFLFANDDEGSVSLLFPSSMSVNAGQSRPIALQVRIDFSRLAPESSFEEYEAFLTFTETTGGGDVLRVPVHLLPYARANAIAADGALRLPAEATLTLANDGIRATNADLYQLGATDPDEDLIKEAKGLPKDPDDWFDIRHTGAHEFGTIGTVSHLVEFALVTQGRRSVANLMVTTIFLDLDGGGADYRVQVADLGQFSTPPTFDGRMAAGIFHIPSGEGIVRFIVADDRNTALQTAPFRVSDLNNLAAGHGGPALSAANPSFEYWVQTMDLETGQTDESSHAAFNAFAPAVSASPSFLSVPAGGTATTTVSATADGALLVLFYNNDSGRRQSQIVSVDV